MQSLARLCVDNVSYVYGNEKGIYPSLLLDVTNSPIDLQSNMAAVSKDNNGEPKNHRRIFVCVLKCLTIHWP